PYWLWIVLCERTRCCLCPYSTLFRSFPLPRRGSRTAAPPAAGVPPPAPLRPVPARPFPAWRDRSAARHGRDRRPAPPALRRRSRSEGHTSELQSRENLACRLLPEKQR